VSKVIRTANIRRSAVTLGEADRALSPEGVDDGEKPAIDLAALVVGRTAALETRLNHQWQERLDQAVAEVRQEAAAAAAQVETEQQQKLDQVHAERYEEGYNKGVADQSAEVEEAVQRLDVLHEALKQDRSQVLLQAENLVLELASALALRVARIRVEEDHKILVHVIRSALEHLSEESNLVIKVNKEDMAIARKFVVKWVEKVGTDAILKVQVSDHVGRGGCMIEGREESVDARLEEQFTVLREAMKTEVFEENRKRDE
jgi:flagellar assembly protein FliH